MLFLMNTSERLISLTGPHLTTISHYFQLSTSPAREKRGTSGKIPDALNAFHPRKQESARSMYTCVYNAPLSQPGMNRPS